MNFITCGNRNNRSLLLIHGMATTAMQCYGKILPYLSEYYIILCEVDGHSDDVPGDFISIEDSCRKIEEYILQEHGGEVYGLCGLSMGATLAVYTYDIPENLSAYKNQIAFWRGEREPYPKKSARILKKFLPQLREEVFPKMGHAQYLSEHPDEYAKGMLHFFS